jgi:type I restriction enzyme S subunit
VSLQTFFDNFTLLADAPNSIPLLRELILQLAIEGKLVSQTPSDEPASVLLERIKKREVKVRRKEKKDSTPLFAGEDIEPPFDLPSTWIWARLSDVGHDWGQKKPDVKFTYIDVAAIDNERGSITDEVKLLKPSEAPSRARKLVTDVTQ